MKARIKKTGEIVNLAPYAKITLEQCDSWGNPIELKPEEVELIEEPTEDEHWQDVRERAAIAALQAYIPENKGDYMICNSDKKYKDTAIKAIQYADALVEQLKNN